MFSWFILLLFGTRRAQGKSVLSDLSFCFVQFTEILSSFSPPIHERTFLTKYYRVRFM